MTEKIRANPIESTRLGFLIVDLPDSMIGNKGLNPGRYILEVLSATPQFQPPSVQGVIGSNGQLMVGPLVGGCCFGAGEPWTGMTLADAEKMKETLKFLRTMGGSEVYYARYVDVPDDTPAPAQHQPEASITVTPPPRAPARQRAPVAAQQAPAAPAAATSSQAASVWYYFESSKSYYPYVPECKEGWRTVPTTPPDAGSH